MIGTTGIQSAPRPIEGPGEIGSGAVQGGHPEQTLSLQAQLADEKPLALTDDSVFPELFPPINEDIRSMEDLLLLLSTLNAETTHEQMNSAREGIEIDKAARERRHDERMEKIQEAIDALEEAEKAGVLGKIFGWISSIFMAIAGAALIATGVGTVAGSLLLAASAVVMASQISGETGDWMSEGLSEMFEAFGVPESQSELAATLFVTAVVLALSIGSGVAGAMGPAATAADAAVRVAQVASIAGGVAAVGQGSSGIASATYAQEAAEARADSAEQQAFIRELLLYMQDKNERLRELVEDFKRGVQISSDGLAALHQTKSEIVANTRM